ncbi:GABA transporter 1 [Linum perenne]
MASLWISLDNINCSSCTSESTLCFVSTGLDWWSVVPHSCSYSHLLLIQSAVFSSRAPRTAWESTASISRHGHTHLRQGPKWGKYCVGPLQIGVCYGSVVASILLGGQSLKFIYLLYRPNGGMKLYHFISLFGGMTVLLAQMPSFHSLRHINLVSILLCLAYSTCATVASVHIGHSKMAPTRDYSLDGSPVDQLFGTFNGISIIATVYASLVIPEIQVYLQPTNEVLENWFADPKADQFAMRNVIPRLVSRTLAVISATFLAALLPFFGDIMALFGAFACIPLNFILPMVFYNITFKPSRNAAVLWIHRAIVAVSSILVAVGAVASVRQIVRDAKTYSLFANV